MKVTTKEIIASIVEAGFIEEAKMRLLKNRSNREQRDLLDYNALEKVNGGYGIPVTEEQGAKGLAWLKKFIKKDGSSNVYGWRELNIIANADPKDFVFLGFYDAGNGWFRNYIPIYGIDGLQYIPMREPYIIG